MASLEIGIAAHGLATERARHRNRLSAQKKNLFLLWPVKAAFCPPAGGERGQNSTQASLVGKKKPRFARAEKNRLAVFRCEFKKKLQKPSPNPFQKNSKIKITLRKLFFANRFERQKKMDSFWGGVFRKGSPSCTHPRPTFSRTFFFKPPKGNWRFLYVCL